MRGAGRLPTVTAGESKGSDGEDDPGGAAAGGGTTTKATYKDEAPAEAGGRHGAGRGERARVAGWRENPVGDSSRVGNQEGGHEASGVTENPGGTAREWKGE